MTNWDERLAQLTDGVASISVAAWVKRAGMDFLRPASPPGPAILDSQKGVLADAPSEGQPAADLAALHKAAEGQGPGSSAGQPTEKAVPLPGGYGPEDAPNTPLQKFRTCDIEIELEPKKKLKLLTVGEAPAEEPEEED